MAKRKAPVVKLDRPRNPYSRTILRQTKVNAEEAATIEQAAKRLTGGNTSEYLRLAAIEYARTTKGRKTK